MNYIKRGTKSIAIISCLVIFTLSVFLSAASGSVFSERKTLVVPTEFEAISSKIIVTEAAFTNSPKWHEPYNTEAPLSVVDAIARANHTIQLRRNYPIQYYISSVRLQNMQDDDWVYIISFRPVSWKDEAPYAQLIETGEWDPDDEPRLNMVILMDGSIMNEQ